MNTTTKPAGLFSPGKLNSSPGIAYAFGEEMQAFMGKGPRPFVWQCLDRHLSGDWGGLSDDDKEANDMALLDDSRIFSAYRLPADMQAHDSKIWIITEAKDDEGRRAFTTVLFPSEY